MDVTIKKGKHYRSNYLIRRIKIGFRWSREYEIVLDSSCCYELDQNKTQVNKLVGVGNLHHHLNSIRVGWRWNNDNKKFELFLYSYSNGERVYFRLYDAAIGEKIPVAVNYTIKGKNVTYTLKIGNTISSYGWKIERWWQRIPFLYECFPYFGGIMPAPKKININIKNKQR